MKKLIYNITLSLCLIFACNSVDPEPEPDDPLDIQANLLNGKWILKDESSAVKDGSIISDFKDITLTFSGGTKSGGDYATTNSIDADVWPNSGSWQFTKSLNECVKDADAIVILTAWEEYKNLDFQEFHKLMRKPSWVFDTRKIISRNSLKETGIKFWQVGTGTWNI